MLELFSSETTLLLGLDLSDEEDKLIQTAISLVKKTGSRLLLVHAIQPFRTYATTGEDMILPTDAYEQSMYVTDLEESQQKLQAIRDRLPADLMIDILVCREYPELALDLVAEEVKASLIICGMRTEATSPWYGGPSTALSLMGSSRFPVMVLPLHVAIDFSTRDHNILVADNLRDEGLYALKAALGLCRSISYRQLIHLHVKNTSYRDINDTADRIKMAMIEGRLPSNPDFEATSYLKQMKDELKSVMHDRLKLADNDFAQGLHWSPRIRFGQPAEELQHLVKESRSDIVVFGKHHFLRPMEWELGKIPYQAMLEQQGASLVIPEPFSTMETALRHPS